MLPLLYPDAKTRDALLVDPQTAPIPTLHHELFRFAENFVRGSWSVRPDDLQRLREVGLSDRDIVQWATLGSTQSWFTTSADGGGVPLEGDALTGPGVGRSRGAYEATPGGLLAAPADTSPPETSFDHIDSIACVDTDLSNVAYREAAAWSRDRYGFVPNLFRAVSLQPAFYRRHQLAIELLEGPQSSGLAPIHHAMIRVLVTHLNRSRYSEPTTTALLSRVGGTRELADRLRDEPLDSDWNPTERAVLALASKFARSAYKVTEKDATSLRQVGFNDEVYVDILNTVSIQTSLDRLTNVLGVQPDPLPLLPLA